MGVISWFKGVRNPVPKTVSYSKEEIQERFKGFLDIGNYRPNKFQLFLSQFWDSFDKPPVYRWYLHKLDANVMAYFFLSFFIKTLDNTNISNAFVSGMKEDLKLYGQQRNLFNTTYYVGYILGAIPSQFLINKIRPSFWLPCCELAWSFLVMAIALSQSATPIYVLRFFIGLFESTTYPAIAMMLGSWYLPSELAKRMSVYDLASALASMTSGLIQAGVYSSMNGLGGVAGWRWLFIIDGIIGLPICLLGFFSIPDFPNTTRAVWLTEVEKDFSVIRMAELGQKSTKKLTFKRFFSYFKNWRLYGFNWPYVLFNISSTYTYFNLWLKSLDIYTVEQVNLIPCAGYAMAIITCYLFANISDRMGSRWEVLMVNVVLCFVGNLLISIWNIPFWLKYIAFFLPELGYSVWALILTWASEAFQDDAELRGMLSAVGNTVSYAITAWLPLLAFPTQDAPKYKWGYELMTALNFLSGLGVIFFVVMERREKKQKGRVTNKYGLAVDIDDLVDFDVSVGQEESSYKTESNMLSEEKKHDISVTVNSV
ncbi:major facilitator superfamily domain-containing protein [Dipodascopsis uninucleata]